MNLFGEESLDTYKSLTSLIDPTGLDGYADDDLSPVTDGGGNLMGYVVGKKGFGVSYYANFLRNNSAATPVANTANLAYNSSNKFYYVNSAGAISLLASEAYVTAAIASAVTGVFDLQGGYNASTNLFPTASDTNPVVAAIKKGMIWNVTVAGTLGGVAVDIGDMVLALVDTPGQTASNWLIEERNWGYEPVPYTGAYKTIDFNSQNVTGVAEITANAFSTTSGYYFHDDGQIFGTQLLLIAGGGTVSINPAASGSWDLTLPDSGGTVDYLVKTNGSGVWSYVNPSTITGAYLPLVGATYTTTTTTGLALTTSTLESGTLVSLTSTGNGAAGNTQTIFKIIGSGTATGQTTTSANISNTHTGVGSINYALLLNASGGGSNYALRTLGGNIQFNSSAWEYFTSTDSIDQIATHAAGDMSYRIINGSTSGSQTLVLGQVGLTTYNSTYSGSGLTAPSSFQISSGLATNIWVGTNDFSVWNGAAASEKKVFAVNTASNTSVSLYGKTIGTNSNVVLNFRDSAGTLNAAIENVTGLLYQYTNSSAISMMFAPNNLYALELSGTDQSAQFYGAAKFGQNSNVTGTITIYGATSGNATITTGSTLGNLLLQAAAGNVGIRQSTPLALLHIGAGSDAVFAASVIGYFSNAGTTSIEIRDSTNDSNFIIQASSGAATIGSITNTRLDLITNNGTAISISTAQAVKIVSLAGVGSRPVVAAADGTLSAP